MSKVISRGLGRRNSILSRGLGFLYKTHDKNQKKKFSERTLEYHFNLEVPIHKSNKIILNLYSPIYKFNNFEHLVNQNIYKIKHYEYLVNNSIYKNVELGYDINLKINHKKLINILEALFVE
jgi:hypothetical protein